MRKPGVMIDLETMSTRPTAVVISIGAVKFNDDGVTDRFKVNISPKSYQQYGNKFHVSPDTVEWWSKQSPEARAAWRTDPYPVEEAFQMFSDWYGPKSFWTWGNGSAFDISIMENAYNVLGMDIPWNYGDVMCLRTMCNMTNTRVDRSEGVFHDALVDAENQAKFLIKLLS